MRFNYKKLKFKGLFIFIGLTLLILMLSASYFVYFRFRSNAIVFVSGTLVKNLNYPNTDIYWVPFWQADAITQGDKEYSPTGALNAEILDKESIPGRLNGQQVNLFLSIKAIKDRTGLLLYKNKPLSVGGIIELRLPKTTVNFLITDISKTRPQVKTRKIFLDTYVKELEPWQSGLLMNGSEIKNNKNEVLAKIIDIKIDFARVIGENDYGQTFETVNRLKREVKVKVELSVSEKYGNYYFFGINKISPNQEINFSWNDGEYLHQIVSVSN